MKMFDIVTHTHQVSVHFSEAELQDILSFKLAELADFKIDENTKVKVIISKKERAGTSGFEPYAEVTLVNELGGDES